MTSAYIFAAADTLPTSRMEKDAIAFYPMSSCAIDSKYHGIYFTLDEPQEIILGFQADMAQGATQQEFRIASLLLLKYDDEATGIEEIPLYGPEEESTEEAQGPARYYTIEGLPLTEEPEHGFFIKWQGGKGYKMFKP